MKNITYDFHGTKMTIKLSTLETNGSYCVIHFVHQPNVGPALHIHPEHPETFQIIKGDYKFLVGNQTLDAKMDDTVVVPNGTPHKFKVGNNGGEFLVISPPNLDNYFYEVSHLLTKGNLTWDMELTIAKKYGQIFLENENHWKSD